MPQKDDELKIPIHLARLLAAEPDDFKDREKAEDARAVARSMLRLLLRLHEG